MTYDTMVQATFNEHVLKHYPDAEIKSEPHANGYINILTVRAKVNGESKMAYCECGSIDNYRQAFKYICENFNIPI